MKRWIFGLIPILLLGSLIGWRLNQKRSESLAQAGQREARKKMAPLVATAAIEVRDVVHVFEATGTIESPQNVNMAAKVSGRIDFLQVREGDHVRKGQILIRIDPSQVEAEVHQQMAALAEAKYKLAQAEMIQNPNDVSVNTQIQQQKAGAASAKADYRQVQETSKAQIAAASANVIDAQSKIDGAKSAVNGAQANLNNAKTQYDRLSTLFQKGFVAAQDVDNAKAAVAVQESGLEIAQEQLKSANAMKDAAQQQLNIAKSESDANIEAANARYVQAKASLEYAEANTSQKSAYRQSIEALKAGVDAAKASLLSTQAQLRDTVLVSPLDGFVTARYLDQGAMATPGQPIIAVQFIKQIWVTISVPEEESTSIHLGQTAAVKLDALPGSTFTGSVVQVNPSADLASRQFMVRIIMSNADGSLKPGMFARVSIETERVKNAIVAPREAIKHDDRMGDYVVVVGKDGKAECRPIVQGISDNRFIVIEQGVKPGEKVVIMSTFPLRAGMPVRESRPGGQGKPHGQDAR